jgi:hypothetical protein
VNDISRNWFEVGNPDHSFTFTPNSSGDVSATTFTGSETTFDGAATVVFDLEGSFTGRQISFSRVDSPSQKAEGTFLDRNTMQLTTSTGQIRLARIVAGRVVDSQGSAVSGAQVLIGGAQVVTAQDGGFDLGGGEAVPYDAIVVVDADGKKTTMEYMGLTRADPTLMVFQPEPLPPGVASDPSAPALQLPDDSPETPVDTSTVFSWTAFAGGVHMLNIVPVDATLLANELHVVTGETSAQIPDLSALGTTALSPMTVYSWFVDGFGPFNGIDDAAGPSGLVPPGGKPPIPSDPRTFTTAAP